MNEDVLEKYRKHLRQEHRKKNTVYSLFSGVNICLNDINKPIEEIILEDLNNWKIKINEEQKVNTIRTWIIAVNRFFKWLDKPELKLR